MEFVSEHSVPSLHFQVEVNDINTFPNLCCIYKKEITDFYCCLNTLGLLKDIKIYLVSIAFDRSVLTVRFLLICFRNQNNVAADESDTDQNNNCTNHITMTSEDLLQPGHVVKERWKVVSIGPFALCSCRTLTSPLI